MGKADEDDDKNKESFFSNTPRIHSLSRKDTFWCVFYQGLGILEILKQRDSWLMRRIVPFFSQAASLLFFFFLNTGSFHYSTLLHNNVYVSMASTD